MGFCIYKYDFKTPTPTPTLPSSKMSFRLYLTTFHFLLTLLHANALTAPAITLDGNETDRLALLAFKSEITDDPLSTLSSWNDSLHFCGWQGVSCSPRHQRVTILDLRSKGLVGFLSPYIGNLSFLRQIILSNNTLQGEIPQELGRLFRLQVLILNTNSLSGEVLSNLSRCSNLVILSIHSNLLVGKIPPEFASLSKLQSFVFHKNNISGFIPSSLGNFTSLKMISATFNALEGKIPDTLGKLKSLKYLALGANKLSGTLPPSLYNLSSITNFSLANNELSGGLQPDLFLKFPRLQSLQMYNNKFSGSIPISLSNASELDYIELSENNFTGKVSPVLGGLQRLRDFRLWGNKLGEGKADEMNFLNSLTNCSNLEAVDIQSNKFQGTLPNVVGNISTKLHYLALASNQMYGVIPSGIGHLVNLTHLNLGENMFTGEIPSAVGNLQQLRRLMLHANKLSGTIPFSLGNLSLLFYLYLPHNNLQGAIPPSLGDLKSLTMLDLSRNNLNGTIPKHLFQVTTTLVSLYLAENDLAGPLPPDVGNLTNLVDLYVSDNKLSGEIPSDLGQCLGLENLYMEANFFQGSIPPSLSSLKGIQNLDLSGNNLSGQISKYLEDFPLKMLNLSFNDFEGEVPIKGVFSNASAFSFTGNPRLCGGMVELKLPKCDVKVSKKRKISKGFLVAIPIASTILGTIIVLLVCCWLRKRRQTKYREGSPMKEFIMKVSYQDLLKASGGFSYANLIGVGSFGSVYKGDLDKTSVAIKVLDLKRRGASKSFTAECEALRNIRHRNLVKVITSCSSVDFQGNEFKALVYEFMQNGNLDGWLHQTWETKDGQQDEVRNLDLLQRINIAIDVACALDYIHNQCEKPIVHCDRKPANILLGIDMTAHVGDFGLARFLPELASPSQTSSLGIKGTIGYAAPEYGTGNEPSTFGDVYSYGVLLLEMITGKRPTDHSFVDSLNLHKFVNKALPDRVLEIVDPKLICPIEVHDMRNEATSSSSRTSQSDLEFGKKSKECLLSIAKMGVACSVETPNDRMDISSVVNGLLSLKDALLHNGAHTHNIIEVHGV